MDNLIKTGGCLISIIAILAGISSLAIPNESEKLMAPYVIVFGVLVLLLVWSYDSIPGAKPILAAIVGALLAVYVASNIWSTYKRHVRESLKEPVTAPSPPPSP
ncbi:MAG TPA: hypothetical protein VF440_08795 [Novosphingobium sp.]